MTDNNQNSPSQKVAIASKNKVTYVSPGAVDNEGFLAPPPPSTLRKRKKTSTSSSSTFVVSSSSVGSSEPDDICHVCKLEYNGNHFCKKCLKRVHAFCGISEEDDEGYGGQVTCYNCNKETGTGKGAVEPDNNGHQSEGLSVSESLRRPGEGTSAIDKDLIDEPVQTQKPSDAEVKLRLSKTERSADEILISDILEQGSSSGCSLRQAMAMGNVAPDKEVNAPIPKLILSKVKSSNAKGKKRGPRGKYKKRKQSNIDQSTGKRRYTRKKAGKPETAAVDPEVVTETIDLETGHDSEDSDGSVKMAWLADNGIWNPMDDLRLLYNMAQLQNLEHVHVGVRFSCKFTLEQVTARWKSLFMADEKANWVMKLAIKKLRPMLKDRIRKQVCFSTAEDDLIKQIPEPTTGNPDITVFQNLLDQNIDVFFKYRTARIILKHWVMLRELNFLDCQKGLDLPDSAMLEQLKLENDKALADNVELPVIRAILYENRALLRRMKKLDIEIKNLTAIADSVILKGSNVELKMNKLNNLATLKGRKVQFLMKSKEVTFGKRTDHNQVDIDLQLEGNSNTISRLQGKISFDSDGQFRIHNFGRHAIFVDGKPLHPHYVTSIEDESLIMIGNLSFVFSVNHSIVRQGHLVEQENKKSESEQAGPKSTETSPTPNPNPNETVNKKSPEMPGCSKDAV